MEMSLSGFVLVYQSNYAFCIPSVQLTGLLAEQALTACESILNWKHGHDQIKNVTHV